MAEYIEREALNKIIDREIDICNSGMIRGELEYLKAIVPISADVVEVKRGRWIWDKRFADYYCSECHDWDLKTPNFCSNCGADMREVDHETD